MPRICLFSDTHGYIDDAMISHINTCDEVWHAGDIGLLDVVNKIERLKPLRAVYGNIDDTTIRSYTTETLRFECGGVDVLMTHIGGYPKHYDARIKHVIREHAPKLFIAGHSHILKVMYDKDFDMLHINPGAIGKNGFHKVRTLVKFTVAQATISDLEIVEFPRY